MTVFHYQHGALHCESRPLNTLAQEFGSPLFVYSQSSITDNFQSYQNALGDREGLICYAVKANSNLAILQLLARLGSGFDIVSGGELERVLRAGGDPKRVVFSGVGKTVAEMQRALAVGIHCFNVESKAELEQLACVASDMKLVAPISLRVNPDVDAQTHPYISTGLKENKFGVSMEDALPLFTFASQHPALKVTGIDCHIGSQLTQSEPFLDALDRVLALVDQLNDQGITLEHIDLGGGLGVTYADETPPSIEHLIRQILARLGDRPQALVLEPGRSIVANAGTLVTQVLYTKNNEDKHFAIVDAAMNDNIRPALYQSWQRFLPVSEQASQHAEAQEWDIVGPVCETGDFLAKNRHLSIASGDLLAMMSSGAYTASMSSNYNTRSRAAEVLVDGEIAHLIRKRESFEDIIHNEILLSTTESE